MGIFSCVLVTIYITDILTTQKIMVAISMICGGPLDFVNGSVAWIKTKNNKHCINSLKKYLKYCPNINKSSVHCF